MDFIHSMKKTPCKEFFDLDAYQFSRFGSVVVGVEVSRIDYPEKTRGRVELPHGKTDRTALPIACQFQSAEEQEIEVEEQVIHAGLNFSLAVEEAVERHHRYAGRQTTTPDSRTISKSFSFCSENLNKS